MDVFPEARVERFEQLKPGDLFLAEIAGHKMAALKACEDRPDGDKLMTLLGPTFPSHIRAGQLVQWERLTVLNLGSDFTLELPAQPEKWSPEAPAPDCLAIVQTPDGVFVRTYFHDVRGLEQWVAMEGGAVVKPHYDLVMYTTRWALSVRNTYGERFPVIELAPLSAS
jgi:hypothetical protein